jgi:hypothetical protein
LPLILEYAAVNRPQLEHEFNVYKALSGGVGIPRVHWFRTERDHNAMIMDLLGPSLETLFTTCSHTLSHFNLQTVLLLADQMASALYTGNVFYLTNGSTRFPV